MKRLRTSLLMSVGLILAGCASLAGPGPTEPVADRGKETPAKAPVAEQLPTVKATERSPAVDALLAQARAQRATGSYEQAAVSVERALRIDARSAALWLELAQIRFDQGEFEAAQQFAEKARRLAGVDETLATEAERVLRAVAAELS